MNAPLLSMHRLGMNVASDNIIFVSRKKQQLQIGRRVAIAHTTKPLTRRLLGRDGSIVVASECNSEVLWYRDRVRMTDAPCVQKNFD